MRPGTQQEPGKHSQGTLILNSFQYIKYALYVDWVLDTRALVTDNHGDEHGMNHGRGDWRWEETTVQYDKHLYSVPDDIVMKACSWGISGP